jgi:hypothetical protein
MSVVHNQFIGGRPETMRTLLIVRARFSDATETQIAVW